MIFIGQSLKLEKIKIKQQQKESKRNHKEVLFVSEDLIYFADPSV